MQHYSASKYPEMPSKFAELLLRMPELHRVCQGCKEMLCPRQQPLEGETTPGFNLLMELLRGDLWNPESLLSSSQHFIFSWRCRYHLSHSGLKSFLVLFFVLLRLKAVFHFFLDCLIVFFFTFLFLLNIFFWNDDEALIKEFIVIPILLKAAGIWRMLCLLWKAK